MVGALLDAVDIVAARPPADRRHARAGIAPADVRRLAARARSKDAVLMPFVYDRPDADTAPGWPHADVRLHTREGAWSGIGAGNGRLRALKGIGAKAEKRSLRYVKGRMLFLATHFP